MLDFDLLLATYVINPTNVSNEFKKVALHYDYDDVLYDEEVYGKGAKRAVAQIEKVAQHSIDIATAVFKLKETALEQLKEQEQLSLFEEMEMPKNLRAVGITDDSKFEIMAEKAAAQCANSVIPLTKEDIIKIYKLAF